MGGVRTDNDCKVEMYSCGPCFGAVLSGSAIRLGSVNLVDGSW